MRIAIKYGSPIINQYSKRAAHRRRLRGPEILLYVVFLLMLLALRRRQKRSHGGSCNSEVRCAG
jgi:hypothetical protein